MELSNLNTDGLWHISTLPESLSSYNVTSTTNAVDITTINGTANFSLPAWDGQATSLGVSIDSSTNRDIFYIGTDQALHQVSELRDKTWELKGVNQSTSLWPLAASPSADFAIASDSSSNVVRIYYFVNASLMEISSAQNQHWQPAAAVASTATLQSPTTGSTAPAGSSTQNGSSDSALLTGAKAGIGVGVSVGALAMLGTGAVVSFLVRRRRAAERAQTQLVIEQAPYNPDHCPPPHGGLAYASKYGQSTPGGALHSELSASTMGGGNMWQEQKGYGAHGVVPVGEMADTQLPVDTGGLHRVSELGSQHGRSELMG